MEKLKVLFRWFSSSLIGMLTVVIFSAIMVGIGKLFTYVVDARPVEIAILLTLGVIVMMMGLNYLTGKS